MKNTNRKSLEMPIDEMLTLRLPKVTEYYDSTGRELIPVVRCKDCQRNGTKLCPMLFTEMKNEDYCSYGERKEDETD